MYYRVADAKSPMSDWGHAMFSDYINNWQGRPNYRYDGRQSISIAALADKIKAAWDECRQNGNFGNVSPAAEAQMMDVSADDALACYAPEDIIDSAGGYDDYDWLVWLCEHIVEPGDIKAITTPDGAIVFDEGLIERI